MIDALALRTYPSFGQPIQDFFLWGSYEEGTIDFLISFAEILIEPFGLVDISWEAVEEETGVCRQNFRHDNLDGVYIWDQEAHGVVGLRKYAKLGLLCLMLSDEVSGCDVLQAQAFGKQAALGAFSRAGGTEYNESSLTVSVQRRNPS